MVAPAALAAGMGLFWARGGRGPGRVSAAGDTLINARPPALWSPAQRSWERTEMYFLAGFDPWLLGRLPAVETT